MNKIAVLVDSGSQIEMNNDKGIFVVPLIISINQDVYLDMVNTSSEQIFSMMEKGDCVIKTSQPSTGSIVETIQDIKAKGYDHIVIVAIASGLSATGQGMVLACSMEDIGCTLIDTKATAFIQRFIAYKVVECIDLGMTVEEIVEISSNYIENSGTVIMTPNLVHLKNSGRLTTSAMLLANLLKIVPVMFLNKALNGTIDVLDKVRTLKKANYKIFDYMMDVCGVNGDEYIVVIQHVNCLAFATEMKAILEERLATEVEISLLPSVVGGHMGIGGLGYQFIKKV